MRKIASKWVPHDLTKLQKWLQYDAAPTNLQHYVCEGEAFLRRIITIDEIWTRSYEPKLKVSRTSGVVSGSLQKSTVRQSLTNVKSMAIIAYDWNSVRVSMCK